MVVVVVLSCILLAVPADCWLCGFSKKKCCRKMERFKHVRCPPVRVIGSSSNVPSPCLQSRSLPSTEPAHKRHNLECWMLLAHATNPLLPELLSYLMPSWVTTTKLEETCENQQSRQVHDNEDVTKYFAVQTIQPAECEDQNVSYLGCVALRDIPKHTLLHTELPLLHGEAIWKAKDNFDQGIHTTKEEDDSFLQQELNLSDFQRAKLWQLHDQRNASNSKRLMGIILSNSFCNSDFGREPSLFVGLTSRFNHSCRPNAYMDFSAHHIRIFTTRHVPAGKEICLCYNDVVYHHSAKVRKAFLRHMCHFDCQCEACRPSSLDSNQSLHQPMESDARRRYIATLAQHLLLLQNQLCKPRDPMLSIYDLTFLYNDSFEKNVRKVQKEELMDFQSYQLFANTKYLLLCEQLSFPDYNDDASAHFLRYLLAYMELLQLEGLDHDMLQCYELAYLLTVQVESSTSLLLATSHTSTSFNDNFAFCGNDAFPTSSYWGEKTLALYKLQKGPNHTATKRFQDVLTANAAGIDGKTT